MEVEGVNEETIARVMEMAGCSLNEAEFVLGASGGDIDLAVQLYKGMVQFSRVSFTVGDGLGADRVSRVQRKLQISLGLLRVSHRGLIRLQIDKKLFEKRIGWTL